MSDILGLATTVSYTKDNLDDWSKMTIPLNNSLLGYDTSTQTYRLGDNNTIFKKLPIFIDVNKLKEALNKLDTLPTLYTDNDSSGRLVLADPHLDKYVIADHTLSVYITKVQMCELLKEKSIVTHTHDDLYFTKTEIARMVLADLPSMDPDQNTLGWLCINALRSNYIAKLDLVEAFSDYFKDDKWIDTESTKGFKVVGEVDPSSEINTRKWVSENIEDEHGMPIESELVSKGNSFYTDDNKRLNIENAKVIVEYSSAGDFHPACHTLEVSRDDGATWVPIQTTESELSTYLGNASSDIESKIAIGETDFTPFYKIQGIINYTHHNSVLPATNIKVYPKDSRRVKVKIVNEKFRIAEWIPIDGGFPLEELQTGYILSDTNQKKWMCVCSIPKPEVTPADEIANELPAMCFYYSDQSDVSGLDTDNLKVFSTYPFFKYPYKNTIDTQTYRKWKTKLHMYAYWVPDRYVDKWQVTHTKKAIFDYYRWDHDQDTIEIGTKEFLVNWKYYYYPVHVVAELRLKIKPAISKDNMLTGFNLAINPLDNFNYNTSFEYDFDIPHFHIKYPSQLQDKNLYINYLLNNNIKCLRNIDISDVCYQLGCDHLPKDPKFEKYTKLGDLLYGLDKRFLPHSYFPIIIATPNTPIVKNNYWWDGRRLDKYAPEYEDVEKVNATVFDSRQAAYNAFKQTNPDFLIDINNDIVEYNNVNRIDIDEVEGRTRSSIYSVFAKYVRKFGFKEPNRNEIVHVIVSPYEAYDAHNNDYKANCCKYTHDYIYTSTSDLRFDFKEVFTTELQAKDRIEQLKSYNSHNNAEYVPYLPKKIYTKRAISTDYDDDDKYMYTYNCNTGYIAINIQNNKYQELEPGHWVYVTPTPNYSHYEQTTQIKTRLEDHPTSFTLDNHPIAENVFIAKLPTDKPNNYYLSDLTFHSNVDEFTDVEKIAFTSDDRKNWYYKNTKRFKKATIDDIDNTYTDAPSIIENLLKFPDIWKNVKPKKDEYNDYYVPRNVDRKQFTDVIFSVSNLSAITIDEIRLTHDEETGDFIKIPVIPEKGNTLRWKIIKHDKWQEPVYIKGIHIYYRLPKKQAKWIPDTMTVWVPPKYKYITKMTDPVMGTRITIVKDHELLASFTRERTISVPELKHNGVVIKEASSYKEQYYELPDKTDIVEYVISRDGDYLHHEYVPKESPVGSGKWVALQTVITKEEYEIALPLGRCVTRTTLNMPIVSKKEQYVQIPGQPIVIKELEVPGHEETITGETGHWEYYYNEEDCI